MLTAKKLELLAGVKAEQSLRDAVRDVVDDDLNDCKLELVPFGRKDWIAGIRVGADMKFSMLSIKCKEVMVELLKLESRQRIRNENIRIYVVPKPVPVFKDPVEDDSKEFLASTEEEEQKSPPVEETRSGPSKCPICNRIVHSYNLQYNTTGAVAGCFMCGGNPGRQRG